MKNRLLLWILVSFAAVFLWQGFKQIGQDTHNLGVALSNLVPSRKSSTVGVSASPISQQTEAATHILASGARPYTVSRRQSWFFRLYQRRTTTLSNQA